MRKRKKPILYVRFPTYYLMCATLLRFQEYYESPRFRGKVFTWEEFLDYFSKPSGKFTYFEKFVGFNLPSWVLNSFRAGKFNPLTKKERRFLGLFCGQNGRFYIIATVRKGNIKDLRHEICHALYYLHSNYRRAVRRCLAQFDLSKIRSKLKGEEYHHALYLDEINAYLTTGLGGLGMKVGSYRKIRKKLRQIFRKFFGHWPHKKRRKFWLRYVTVIDF